MITWLSQLFGKLSAKKSRTAARPFRPQFEGLETRLVPTVTLTHPGQLVQGAVLPHVEIQGLYLGSDWSLSSANSDTNYRAQAGQLDAFLGNLVNGPYLDMLTQAGYGVGRGSAISGQFNPSSINKGVLLTDKAIEGYLQNAINNHVLQAPDANRLYVVYVEDGVEVQQDPTSNSANNFFAYHAACAGTDASGRPADLRYVVVAYPGGVNKRSTVFGTEDTMTVIASHEIAEAVTDPDINYRMANGTWDLHRLGWYDDSRRGEIGDLCDGQAVYLNGFAVQRLVDQHDRPMTPAAATAARPVSFVLNNGGLTEYVNGVGTFLSWSIARVSDQGIDNAGNATVDVVLTNGTAWEYHDNTLANNGWTYLTGPSASGSGVVDARAGQGVSYLIYQVRPGQNVVEEYVEATVPWYQGSWGLLPSLGASGGTVAALDAGTDDHGVNQVALLQTGGNASLWDDSAGLGFLAGNVRSVSCGRGGYIGFVQQDGTASLYSGNVWNGGSGFVGSGVSQLSIGTDANGSLMVDMLYSGGRLDEYRSGRWTTVAYWVTSIGKPRAGLVDVIYNGYWAYEHTAAGWNYLTSTSLGATAV